MTFKENIVQKSNKPIATWKKRKVGCSLTVTNCERCRDKKHGNVLNMEYIVHNTKENQPEYG